LLKLSGLSMDIDRLALICQKAEQEYAMVPCGIMDQMIVAGGRPNHAMLLDCRDLSKRFIPIDSRDLKVLVVNSMVKHELSGGEYAMRRKQCEEGVAILKRKYPEIRALRDVAMPQLESMHGQMSEVVFRRCRHVISENARTTDMAKKLEAQHYDEAGELMVQSHNSLRDDYEVSCPELDFLSAESMTVRGIYGARMTGGGFGGSIVALAQPRAVETLSQHLHKAYTEKFGRQPGVFVTSAAEGASVLE
jgi:galactokinase